MGRQSRLLLVLAIGLLTTAPAAATLGPLFPLSPIGNGCLEIIFEHSQMKAAHRQGGGWIFFIGVPLPFLLDYFAEDHTDEEIVTLLASLFQEDRASSGAATRQPPNPSGPYYGIGVQTMQHDCEDVDSATFAQLTAFASA